ncbi:MAG: lytic transglycosylase domain-containing protein [Bacillota bacterium]
MLRLIKNWVYIISFLFLFILACYLLTSPLIGRFFYPLHYETYIRAAAAESQVDPLLVAAVIHTESGFKPGAVSPRGARGLMQVMPQTAEWIAAEIGYSAFSAEMLFEPRCNIELGTWYLADLLRAFSGDLVTALAAYNGGRGEVNRWLEQGIWDGTEANLEQIPFAETRSFIRRVLKAYSNYRQIYQLKEVAHVYSNVNQR